MCAKLCVIYNPAAGRGRALSRLQKMRQAFGSAADFLATTGSGQGEELARQAALAGYEVVAAAGGDGTVHEVANGLLQAGRPDVALAIVPVGSANDYAFSLGLPDGWWPTGPVYRRPVDVGRIRSGARVRHFINGMGLGFNGAVTMEARRIKHLQGLPLYLLGLLRALLFRFQRPEMVVRLDETDEQRTPTLALTLALGQREGNFLIAPEAKVDDGLFDFLHAGPLTRLAALGFVPGLIVGRLPTHPAVRRGRCRRATVRSEAPLVIHIDGEFFCQPREGICEVEVELLPGALSVLVPAAKL
jgi:diacylglycerol kinase family enzyme